MEINNNNNINETFKFCRDCKEYKPLNDFPNNKNFKDGKNPLCRKCNGIRVHQYYLNHKEEKLLKNKEYRDKNFDRYRNLRYKRRYGITLDDYNILFEKQKGVCLICSRKETRYKQLVVDHNHTTGEVRGLICSKCNNAIGCVCEDINTLENMIEYLKKDLENNNNL